MLLAGWASLSGLRVDFYPNAAVSGTPSATYAVSSTDFQLANFPGSAEVTGMLAVSDADTGRYAFSCSFGGGQIVMVWLNDHLICHTEPPFGNTPSSTDGCPENPLTVGKDPLPLVINIFSVSADSSGAITSATTASVAVRLVLQGRLVLQIWGRVRPGQLA